MTDTLPVLSLCDGDASLNQTIELNIDKEIHHLIINPLKDYQRSGEALELVSKFSNLLESFRFFH